MLNTVERGKASIRTRHRYGEIVELSDKDFKITRNNV